MSKDISIEKLVHIMEHGNCSSIRCHDGGEDRCPLYDTGCDKLEHMQTNIIKAMEYHGITKGDIVEYMIGNKD